jgi:hypothetical protein
MWQHVGVGPAAGIDGRPADDLPEDPMSKRARRRRARKGNAANHGKRPNS